MAWASPRAAAGVLFLREREDGKQDTTKKMGGHRPVETAGMSRRLADAHPTGRAEARVQASLREDGKPRPSWPSLSWGWAVTNTCTPRPRGLSDVTSVCHLNGGHPQSEGWRPGVDPSPSVLAQRLPVQGLLHPHSESTWQTLLSRPSHARARHGSEHFCPLSWREGHPGGMRP